MISDHVGHAEEAFKNRRLQTKNYTFKLRLIMVFLLHLLNYH